jgi:archaellum component FlaF (FlaF/FlaG flagellin family)
MSNAFINVHTFDKCTLTYTQKHFPKNKVDILQQYGTYLLTKNYTDINKAKSMVDIICTNNGNVHNNIDALDILIDLVLSSTYVDVEETLIEQLVDMYTLGQCNSGRVHRLYQIWLGVYY